MSTETNGGMTRNKFFQTLLAAGSWAAAACALGTSRAKGDESRAAEADSRNLGGFVEMARSDLRTEKALYVMENLPLTHDEAVDFWPLQRQYELELNKLMDERTAALTEFVKHYDNMTDAKATELANRAFDLEARRVALKRAYFKKFSKVISPLKAARFFQIENQLDTAMELQVASALPLIK